MSRFLVLLLSPLTKNVCSVDDSFTFVNEIVSHKNYGYVMVSFDMKLLFTNILNIETSNIVL